MMIPKKSLNIFFSTARRIDYFKITLSSLLEYNPEIVGLTDKVFILDDRSIAEERSEMERLVSDFFGKENVHLVTFNSDLDFGYVEKLNFIEKLNGDTEFVLFLEDDWKSVEQIDLEFHIETMRNGNFDVLTLSENFSVQEDEIQEISSINDLYWKNPWPVLFRHTSDVYEDESIYWEATKINNFSLNPSIVKSNVYKRSKFLKEINYEIKFCEDLDFIQYFGKNHKFVHIGHNSLERS